MTLKMIEPGRFAFDGDVIFDTASVVEMQGLKQLESALKLDLSHWQVGLSGIKQADSSALSVCLSWLRFSRKHNVHLCFTDIPQELHALASVCGISDLLNNASCPS